MSNVYVRLTIDADAPPDQVLRLAIANLEDIYRNGMPPGTDRVPVRLDGETVGTITTMRSAH